MKQNKKNSNKICSLSKLSLNVSAKVISVFHPNFSLQKRLLDMGLIVNTKVKITKLSPFNNPVSVMFRSYELVLRKQDIKNIIVEIIE